MSPLEASHHRDGPTAHPGQQTGTPQQSNGGSDGYADPDTRRRGFRYTDTYTGRRDIGYTDPDT